MHYILHTRCRQNIMHEKWGHSNLDGFDIKMTVKSNAIILNSEGLQNGPPDYL